MKNIKIVRQVNASIIEAELIEENQKKRIITPLIKIKLLLNDSLETFGIYDSGSNVSIIKSKLIKLKKFIYNVNNTNLLTINGVKKTKSMINIKIKVFDIEK